MSEIKEKKNATSLATKAGDLLFKIGFVSIFVEIFIPQAKYISMIAFSLSYITYIWREWEKNKKIDPISFVLCMLAIACIIAREFISTKYFVLFAQFITYGFLLKSSYQLLKQIRKGFVLCMIASISVAVLNIVYPSKITTIMNLAMNVWIILQFLDPILREIALDHRAKRLAAEEKNRLQDSQPKDSGF